jgi:6-phosphogluconolactonase
MTTLSNPKVERYPNAEELTSRLASSIAAGLKSALDARGLASLVVSGGHSPVKLFEKLRVQPLDWSRVCIGLVDERWVEPTDENSNEKLLRDHLLRDAAAAARFAGLKNAAPSPELGAASAWESYARVPRPFDVIVLGMGDDGHTASLFPNSPDLKSALDPASTPGCVGMRSPTAPQARISLNLAALLDSRRIILYVVGDAKWRTYTAAMQPGPAQDMPIRAVLRQQQTPVEVAWAP